MWCKHNHNNLRTFTIIKRACLSILSRKKIAKKKNLLCIEIYYCVSTNHYYYRAIIINIFTIHRARKKNYLEAKRSNLVFAFIQKTKRNYFFKVKLFLSFTMIVLIIRINPYAASQNIINASF